MKGLPMASIWLRASISLKLWKAEQPLKVKRLRAINVLRSVFMGTSYFYLELAEEPGAAE